MGACCSGGEAIDVNKVITIQRAVRSFLKRKNRAANVKSFIEEIAGKFNCSLQQFKITAQSLKAQKCPIKISVVVKRYSYET